MTENPLASVGLGLFLLDIMLNSYIKRCKAHVIKLIKCRSAVGRGGRSWNTNDVLKVFFHIQARYELLLSRINRR